MGALDHLPHYTYDDYIHWEGKWELIEGIPYAMSPAPMVKHQEISSNIAWELKNIFKNCNRCTPLLPIDWRITEDTIVQPDNLVICDDSTDKAYITKSPKIIFEILSKSTAKKDIHVKYELYEKEGVPYYIIVDPDEKMAKVYELFQGKYKKLCDTTNDKVTFDILECENNLEFDFSKIW